MNAEPPAARDWDDDLVFRTLAAPGLEEDDLIAARVDGRLWGDGRPPAATAEPPDPLDRDGERRARHASILARWGTDGTPAPNA